MDHSDIVPSFHSRYTYLRSNYYCERGNQHHPAMPKEIPFDFSMKNILHRLTFVGSHENVKNARKLKKLARRTMPFLRFGLQLKKKLRKPALNASSRVNLLAGPMFIGYVCKFAVMYSMGNSGCCWFQRLLITLVDLIT